MAQKKDVHAVDPQAVLDFFSRTLPFSELSRETLSTVAKHVTIDFHPKGVRIMEQDATEVENLHIVQEGGVKLYLKYDDGEDKLIDYRGEGALIGALAIIRGSRANLTVETVEDTFFFLLERDVFQQLVHDHPRFAQFFLKSFSDSYISKAFSELRKERVSPRAESSLYLFSVKVQDLVKGAPQMIFKEAAIQQAASQMSLQQVGSLLVTDTQGQIAGIITDKDLRTKVVASGKDYWSPVEEIMSSPVQRIPSSASCFDALLAMMSRHIHHLAVEHQEEVIGVVTAHDIMVLQGHSPMYLFKEIAGERTFEGLHEMSKKVPLVVRSLIEEGAKANNITRMITVLNDLILERLLTLLLDEYGPPPVPFCWMMMGSEGRKEQTFRTDQDNALIYQDPKDEAEERACEQYFRLFTEDVIQHLVKSGFPLCPGEMMASNPKWRLPYSKWKAFFEDLIYRPEPKAVMHASIFFDFRPGFGTVALGENLREHISELIPRQAVFLRHLADNCLQSRPPLSFFKNFIVEKNGEHKNHLDLKHRGLVPFIDFARLMSLKNKIKETNTQDRLKALADAGHISKDLYSEMTEAFEFIMQLRLVHQLRLWEDDKEPNNFILPGDLTELDKRTLKDAFSLIGKFQSYVKDLFALNV